MRPTWADFSLCTCGLYGVSRGKMFVIDALIRLDGIAAAVGLRCEHAGLRLCGILFLWALNWQDI